MSNLTCKLPRKQASRLGDKKPERFIHPRRYCYSFLPLLARPSGVTHISHRGKLFILVCSYIAQRGLVARCTLAVDTQPLEAQWERIVTDAFGY